MKTEIQEHILNILNEQQQTAVDLLENSSDIILPARSYSSGQGYQCIRVLYISDLHLDMHLINNQIDLNDIESIKRFFDRIIQKMLMDRKGDVHRIYFP